VVELQVAGTHGVRRRVLRDHRPDAGVDLPEDGLPGTVHLGVVDTGAGADADSGTDGAVVAVATLFPEATAFRPGARAARLRGMAVDHHRQGEGIGSLLLAEVVGRAREDGCEVLWANGRDSAVGFYERHGWQVVGDGFSVMGLPHHVVLVDL